MSLYVDAMQGTVLYQIRYTVGMNDTDGMNYPGIRCTKFIIHHRFHAVQHPNHPNTFYHQTWSIHSGIS
jgi:hypothetical protein